MIWYIFIPILYRSILLILQVSPHWPKGMIHVNWDRHIDSLNQMTKRKQQKMRIPYGLHRIGVPSNVNSNMCINVCVCLCVLLVITPLFD